MPRASIFFHIRVAGTVQPAPPIEEGVKASSRIAFIAWCFRCRDSSNVGTELMPPMSNYNQTRIMNLRTNGGG